MDFSFLHDDLGYLLWGTFPDGPPGGALLTLLLSAGSGIASALLGLGLGVALVMLDGVALALLSAVLGLLRAIPVLMLIFWTYFLLPIVFGVDVPGVLSVMAALSLVGGAYLAHAVAAGIRGVGTGQWAAGMALGFTRWGALRHVVLPQALRMMLPSFVNQWVTLIKDSSLAYIVGVGELSFLATQVNARVMVHPTEVFLFVGAVYWLLCSALDWAAGRVTQPFFTSAKRSAPAAAR
jgi:polar amino acid transport system permease protein